VARALASLLLGLALLAASGCAGYVAVRVESRPSGANVFHGFQFLGKTPTGVIVVETSSDRLPLTLEKLNRKPVTVILTVRPADSAAEAKQAVRSVDLVLAPR